MSLTFARIYHWRGDPVEDRRGRASPPAREAGSRSLSFWIDQQRHDDLQHRERPIVQREVAADRGDVGGSEAAELLVELLLGSLIIETRDPRESSPGPLHCRGGDLRCRPRRLFLQLDVGHSGGPLCDPAPRFRSGDDRDPE